MPMNRRPWREPRRQTQPERPLASVVEHPKFKWAAVCVILALIAVVAESLFGGVESHDHRDKLISLAITLGFLILAVLGVHSAAVEAARVVRARADQAAGTTVGVIISVVGYSLSLMLALDLLGIQVKNALLGGAVLALVLGAALQQTLANVFAGLILHLTHPFTVGEHVRIRGSFGGELSGTILAISLTNTVIETAEGMLRLPNAGVNAAALGPVPDPSPEPSAPPAAGRPAVAGQKGAAESVPR
jgi:small-conductance mechanosensitive channel